MGFLCWASWDSERILSVAGHKHTRVANGSSGVIALKVGSFASGGPFFNRYKPNAFTADSPKYFRLHPPFLYRKFERNGGVSDELHLAESIDGFSMAFEELLQPVAGELAPGTSGDWFLYIPYWLILVSIAVLWILLLVWRSRRHFSRAPQAPARQNGL